MCNCENKVLTKSILDFISECKNKEHSESYLVAVLHKVQGELGYLSREAMNEVAYALNVPTSTVFGVATFYNYFKLKPQGKYAISVCMGTACFVKGADQILNTFMKNLEVGVGETTEDGLFSVDVTRCLGVCALAPVVKVNNDIYNNVSTLQVQKIIENYRSEEDNS